MAQRIAAHHITGQRNTAQRSIAQLLSCDHCAAQHSTEAASQALSKNAPPHCAALGRAPSKLLCRLYCTLLRCALFRTVLYCRHICSPLHLLSLMLFLTALCCALL